MPAWREEGGTEVGGVEGREGGSKGGRDRRSTWGAHACVRGLLAGKRVVFCSTTGDYERTYDNQLSPPPM